MHVDRHDIPGVMATDQKERIEAVVVCRDASPEQAKEPGLPEEEVRKEGEDEDESGEGTDEDTDDDEAASDSVCLQFPLGDRSWDDEEGDVDEVMASSKFKLFCRMLRQFQLPFYTFDRIQVQLESDVLLCRSTCISIFQIYNEINADMLGAILGSGSGQQFSCATLYFDTIRMEAEWDMAAFFASLPYLSSAMVVSGHVELTPPGACRAAIKNAFAGVDSRRRWWSYFIGMEWQCPLVRIDMCNQPFDFVNLLVAGLVKVGSIVCRWKCNLIYCLQYFESELKPSDTSLPALAHRRVEFFNSSDNRYTVLLDREKSLPKARLLAADSSPTRRSGNSIPTSSSASAEAGSGERIYSYSFRNSHGVELDMRVDVRVEEVKSAYSQSDESTEVCKAVEFYFLSNVNPDRQFAAPVCSSAREKVKAVLSRERAPMRLSPRLTPQQLQVKEESAEVELVEGASGRTDATAGAGQQSQGTAQPSAGSRRGARKRPATGTA